MKKITLCLFALFACWQMSAQVGVVQNFDSGTTTPAGWTVTGGGYIDTPESCSGNSFIDNLYNFSTTGTLVTPNQVAGSNGTDLTVSFDYKIEDWDSSTAAAPGWGNIQVQYSTDNGGAWTTFFTIDDGNHVVANTCANFSTVIPAASVPNGSDVRFRFLFTWVAGDFDIYIDNFSATQVTALPPSCTVLSNPANGATNILSTTISWNSAPGIPTGYRLNVGTTPGGTDFLNMFDAGNVTSYNLGALNSGTTYYVTVIPYNANGDATGCTESSFTTCGAITTFPSLEPFNTFLPNQCWSQGTGGDLLAGPTTTGTTGNWYVDGLGNVGTTGAVNYNLFTTGGNDWVISPEYSIPAIGYELKLIAAITDYGVTTATVDWDAADTVEILVSTTGTTNWTPLFTYDISNYSSILPAGSLNVLDLDAYSGQTVRFAIRAFEGAAGRDIDFSFDDFEVRMSPTCPDQTGLTVGTITSTTADFSWDDLNASGALGYEYAVTTSATPPASGTATTGLVYSATSLSPQTTYYLHVRASCAASTFGNWATVSFVTNCASVTSFIQNFDTVTTPAFPTCWAKVGAGGTANTQIGSANSAPNTMYFASFSTASLAVVSMQQVSNLGAGTNRIKFDMRANFTVGGVVEFGYLTDPADAATFVSLTTFTASALTYSTYQYSPPVGTYSDYPAFRHTGSPGNSVLIDNVIWEANPACADQTGLVFSDLTTTSVNTSWDAISGATGYEYAVITSATPPASGTPTTDIFYGATGLTPETLYYIHVRPMCSPGVYGNWASVSFYTSYCLPSSSGSASYVNNFSTTGGSQNISNLATGFTAGGYLNASSQFVEGYATSSFNFNAAIVGGTVGFSIWVDWNNDLVFDNATEKVYNTIAYGNGPFTGTIAIPAGTPLGNYRMRITTDWNALNPSNPCAAATRAEFEDYTISVIAQPACVPPSASASGVTDAAANMNWAAVPSATLGYEYVLDNVATDPAGSGTPTTSITYSASGLTQLTTYYFHIRSVCSVGTYSTWNTISFTTLATPPANDNCATASVLTPGATFATNPLVATNVGSTGSTETAPGCALYSGGDVWYSVQIPASGNLTIETGTNTGTTITDTGLAVYSGSCGSLVLVECDDDDSASGAFSLISLVGRPAGELLYVRAWEYGNDTFNTFQVSAYDASLTAASFDTTSFVAYPNPVKDVLNLSYKTAISNVKVINLLGQEVLNTKANTNDVQVNMSALTAGAYIVNITVEDTVHTIKVIKE